MNLNEIRDNKGSRHKSKRLGRGEGSGKGKTCGKGQKGQKARSGVAIKGFEGGQNPLYMRLPKRGFNNIFKEKYGIITLSLLQYAVDKNKIDASKNLTIEDLKNAFLIKNNVQKVKLLGNGILNTVLNIEVDKASSSAVQAIESIKGTVKQLS